MSEHISVSDQVQRHTQAPQPQAHTHTHNGRPCTGHHHSPQNNRQPNHTQYFRMLKQSFSKNRVFFWNEVLNGGVFDEIIRRYSALSWLKCLRSNTLQKLASTVLGFATQFLPNILKPFFAGFFIPLVIFLYVNWKLLSLRIFPSLQESSLHPLIVESWYILILVLFVIVALIGPGSLGSDANKQKTTQLLAEKTYLNNPRVLCMPCEVLKGFRSQHCPNCKQCIPKYSQHSPVFNRCIGASNQFFYLLFNLAIFFGQGAVIYLFAFRSPQDMLLSTKVVVLLLNNHMQWMALVESLKIFILNFWYNLTEHQVKNWMTASYLIAFGKRQFANPLDIGLFNNIKESLYAVFGCQDSEQQSTLITGSIIQPQENQNPYITNWAKVMYINGSELRNHPHRREIAMKTKEMESFMILQTQIMSRVRQEVLNEQKGKRPVHEINQIIMMQTQMELQKEMQKMMMQKMQESQPDTTEMTNQKQGNQKKEQSESKGDESERLIQKEERGTEVNLLQESNDN